MSAPEDQFKEAAKDFYEWCEKQAEKPAHNAKELVLQKLTWMLSNMYEKGAIKMRTSLLDKISKRIGFAQGGGAPQQVAALASLRTEIERTGG